MRVLAVLKGKKLSPRHVFLPSLRLQTPAEARIGLGSIKNVARDPQQQNRVKIGRFSQEKVIVKGVNFKSHT